MAAKNGSKMTEEEIDRRRAELRKYLSEARGGYVTKGGVKRTFCPWEVVSDDVCARRAEQEGRVQRAIKMAKMMKSPTGDADTELTEAETMAAELEAIKGHNDFLARMLTEVTKERDFQHHMIYKQSKEKLEMEDEITEWRKKFDECHTMYKVMESCFLDALNEKRTVASP